LLGSAKRMLEIESERFFFQELATGLPGGKFGG